MLSVRRLGLGEAAGLQDVDFCCAGGVDVSQPFHDSAARHLLPFLVREGHADRRADGTIGCAGGAGLGFGGRERRTEGRERDAAGEAEAAAEDAGQFEQAAIAGPEAERRDQGEAEGPHGTKPFLIYNAVRRTVLITVNYSVDFVAKCVYGQRFR